MNFTYQVVTAFDSVIIKRTDQDGNDVWIPTDLANSDYAEYLAQLDDKPAEIEAE
jgi:hypothetical protein